MSIAPLQSDDAWSVLWSGLVERIEAIDLTSRSATKFHSLATWLAHEWNLKAGEVVCKYVQHSKNRWNRLREALRRRPSAILLLFEGDGFGEMARHLAEGAAACPELRFVVVLTRARQDSWQLGGLFVEKLALLPGSLTTAGVSVSVQSFERRKGVRLTMPTGAASPSAAKALREALEGLGVASGDPNSPFRSVATDALASLAGLPTTRIAFKTIPTTKNLGNRLGEALARGPAALGVICPEGLGDRVLEERERWRGAADTTFILVLCGEETSYRVEGPVPALVERLREALRPPRGRDDAAALISRPTGDPITAQPPVPTKFWRKWSYADWNERLVEYCLGESAAGAGPVERLAATPEELLLLANASVEDLDQVVQAFVDACTRNVPLGTSFCGFCGDYKGRAPRSSNPWRTASVEPPHFFAMLWFTCLVAYGHPDAAGGFYERLWRLVGNKDHIKCLPELWRDVRDWTFRARATHRPIRELVLPPLDDYRTTIGFSHFLAFPHQHDRRLIARVLVEADLVGFEPPITPVIAALQAERDRFSRLFREDLDNFVERFVAGRRDPRESAFWRAIRQEALEPSYSPGSRRARRGLTTVLAVFNDEGLIPLLGCSVEWSPPAGYRVGRLDNAIGNYEHYAEAEVGGLDGVLDVMFSSLALLGPGPRALINQGVLVFQEDQSNEFYLATGHDISGADVALVRHDLVQGFIDAFGGEREASRVDGWTEVTGCSVRPLDDLPESLSRAVQLQRTMNPPTLRLVGGIKVPGGFLGFDGFLPRVRAPGVEDVKVRLSSEVELHCSQRADGDWTLPGEATRELPTRLKVVAKWPLGEGRSRESERSVNLRRAAVDDNYRALVGRRYFLESCCPGQKSIEAGSPIPSGITTADPVGSYDLLGCEPSARFLGPGFGEMSLAPREGFDWLVVGHKGRPELLVFVGDVNQPVPPANRRSPSAGDRRHWKAAFTKAKCVRVRGPDGTYREIDGFPQVAEALRRLSRHNPPVEAETCAETRLDTLSMSPPHRAQPAELTLSLVDALAALSTGRGGLRYRTVQQLFAEMTGQTDYLLHHELIRSLCEAGALDLVRDQAYSSTRLVARRPRFVAVRRGPAVEASLIGLSMQSRVAQVRLAAEARGLEMQEVEAGCPWQPTILRVRASESALAEVQATTGLEPTEWLAWGEAGQVPHHLHAEVERQELWTDVPPEGFVTAKHWRWNSAEFRRGSAPVDEAVRVEQRVHRTSCSIYVVLVDEEPALWTYIRNWALLYAYSTAGKAPFALDRQGWVSMTGRSPVHLPLPLGRLCTVLGEGAPGPTLDVRTKRVEGYCYPFGRRVTELVSRVIPASWMVKG